MAIAITLEQYLSSHGVAFDCVAHERTGSSSQSAEASHVPGDRLAKTVVLKRREGYILAVLPASQHVRLDEVGSWLRQPVGLATEQEIATLFPDCEPGAVTPIAAAYGLKSVVDESLDAQPEVYFEAGDHCTLVHVSGTEFHKLMQKVPHGRFSAPSRTPPSRYPDDELWKYDL